MAGVTQHEAGAATYSLHPRRTESFLLRKVPRADATEHNTRPYEGSAKIGGGLIAGGVIGVHAPRSVE